MQKIIIKNFGAIKDTEIEIKKVLILIGEQATGKSTIAKLIYFFKSVLISTLNSLLYDFAYGILHLENNLINNAGLSFYNFSGFTNFVRLSFYNFFGFIEQDFEVIFFYNEDIWLKLKSDKEEISIEGTIFTEQFRDYANEKLDEGLNHYYSFGDFSLLESNLYTLKDIISNTLDPQQLVSLFTIAGRSTTVGFSDFFENTFYADLKIKENDKILTTDQYLMLEFMNNVLSLKGFFKKYGGFEGLIQLAQGKTKAQLTLVKEKAEKILKGKYSITGDGEKLILNNNEKSVYLSDSSSGQQEAIRIIQDVFYNIRSHKAVLRIIEEPEAHLFPTAQKELVELFALMVNDNKDNQLIITTHSPYILTAFNNLLFANRVVEYNSSAKDEVNNIIPSEFWLQAKDCSVYSLSRDEKYVHNCESIFDDEKGIIKQNYLDTVSEILGSEFNALYKIHAKTFKRK